MFEKTKINEKVAGYGSFKLRFFDNLLSVTYLFVQRKDGIKEKDTDRKKEKEREKGIRQAGKIFNCTLA